MPHTNSARKRMRTSNESRIKNRKARSVIKAKRKEFLDAVASKNKDTAGKALRAYSSILDRSAKRGVIKKNNSIRHKARATKLFKTL